MKSGTFFICLLGLLCSSQVIAQSVTDEQVLGITITKAELKGKDQWHLTVEVPPDFHLAVGSSGQAWGILRKEIKGHNQKLGEATVKSVAEGLATADMISESSVLPGDLFFIKGGVPTLESRSLYFRLLQYGIVIHSEEGNPFYPPIEVLRRDGSIYRTEKFLLMTAEVNRAGATLGKKGDTIHVEAGPHRGQLVHEIMAKADTLQIWTYLYHITLMNDETMGQHISLALGYYNYVREGDAAADTYLKDLFLDNNRDQWETKFSQYHRKLPASWAAARSAEAVEFRKKGELEQANKYHDLSLFVGSHYSDEGVLAGVEFDIAETRYEEKKYDEAIRFYESARRRYVLVKDDVAAARCDVSWGYSLRKSSRAQEATEIFLRGLQLAADKAGPKPGTTWDSEIYRLRAGLAGTYQILKRFPEARKLFEANLELAAGYSWNLGQAQASWGLAETLDSYEKNYASSIPYYAKSARYYLADADTSNAVDGVEGKAVAMENIKQYSESLDVFETGIALTKESTFHQMHARFLRGKGRVLRKLEKWDEARSALQESLKVSQDTHDNSTTSFTLKELAELYQAQKNFAEATRTQLSRLDYLKESGVTTRGDVYWDIAYMNSEVQKDYAQSITHYLSALELYSQSADTSGWHTVLCNLGIVYKQAGDSLNAYRTFDKAIQLTMHYGNRDLLTEAMQKMADAAGKFKNFRKKMEFLQKQLLIYEPLKNHAKLGEISKALGKVYEDDLKDYAKADIYLKRAIAEYDQTTDFVARGDAYWGYAYNVGQNQKRDKEAIDLYEIAYGLYIQAKDTSNASIVRSNVGQSYWSINNFDKAIEAHKAAIFLATRSGQQEQIFRSWNALADLYKNTLNPVASSEALRNAVTAAEKLSDSTLLATTYNDVGNSYGKAKDYMTAISYFNKAMVIRIAQKDSLGIANLYGQIAGMYQNKSDFPHATEYYNKSIALRNHLHDRAGKIYDLVGLGVIQQSVDASYRKAEAYFLEAIQICKETKNASALGFCYERLNSMYRAEGKSVLSDQYRKLAKDTYFQNKNWKEFAEVLTFEGFDAFYYGGDQKKALAILDQAQWLQDTLKDKSIQAEIYDVRSSVLREMGEFDKALGFTDLSMKLYDELDNDWGIMSVYTVRGNIYKQMGNYTTALRFQFKADSILETFNNEYTRFVPYTNIGENYAAQGDYEKALVYYHKANAIFVKANDQNDNVASIQGLIGQAYFYQNNFPESEKWLKQSIVTSEKALSFRSRMENLSFLGRLKIAQKQYDEAGKYLTEGLRMSKEKSNMLTYLSNSVLLGKLEVERKNYDKAKGYLEESITTSRTIGRNATLWESLYLMGVLYKSKGDMPKSKEYLKEAVAVIEKIRNNVSGGSDAQKLFSSDKNILNVYDALIEVLLSVGETEEAMTYLQKNNEQNLKSKFKALDMKFENQNKNRAIEEERSKKAKLDGLEAQISAEKMLSAERQNAEKLKNLEGIKTIAENEYLKFVNQQVNVQPELSRYFNNSVQPTQFRKVKKQIPKDMALVSYLAGENQLYIFAATSDTVIAKIVNVTRVQLTRDVTAMLNVIRNSMGSFAAIDLKSETAERNEMVPDMKQTDPSLKPFEDAYHYLLAPVSSEIAGKKKVCIIATGTLNYIPFQLLGKTLNNGKFSLAMNQFSIFYANSTDMLFRDQKELNKNFKILAFGNPDKTLPLTEREVNDIKRMFPNSSIYLREEATEDKAKFAAESYNVIHFATHGNLDYEDFSKSYLTMAGSVAKNEDGRLTLEELWGMEVMNHLNIVVLSACQTAVTKGSDESSPVSPASGFLQNGVKSVVASLWKVDDEATSVLMAEFYLNIKTMDAVDALRLAQVKLSQTPKFNHPFYWAGFVLMGDWR